MLIVAVGIAAYAGSFHGPWVFDDLPAIKENVSIRHLSGVGEAAWGLPQSPLSRRPVVALSVALNYAWGRYDVRGYHAVNLALHLVSGLLLYGIVRRICTGALLRERFTAHSRPLAAIVSLVWIAHPLNSEAVIYITQRTTLLVSLFELATIYCALRAWQGSRQRAWQASAIGCCALAMASKECAVVLPLLVPLLDRAFFAANWRTAWHQRRALYLGLAACESVLVLLFATGPDCASIGLDTGISPWEYLMTQAGVLVHYLRLVFWPRPLVLTYDWQPVREWTSAIAPGLAVLALLGATIWALVKRPAWGFFGALFFLLLAPTSSIVPISTELLAERRMYLASLAVIVPVVACAYLLAQRTARGLAAGTANGLGLSIGMRVAVPAVVVVLLGWQTMARVDDFRDEITLWRATVTNCPHSPVSQFNLGVALAAAGRYQEAIEHYHRSLALHPNPIQADGHNNLGSAWFHLGDIAAARREFQTAVELDPRDAKAHSNLALALATAGEYPKADAHSRESLRLDPRHVNGRLNRGFVLCRLGRIREAADEYRMAVDLDPESFLPHFNLGLVLSDLQRPVEAIGHFEIASRLNPGDARTHHKLSRLLLEQGRVSEARIHLQAAVRLEPHNVSAVAKLREIEVQLADE